MIIIIMLYQFKDYKQTEPLYARVEKRRLNGDAQSFVNPGYSVGNLSMESAADQTDGPARRHVSLDHGANEVDSWV